MGKTRQKAQLFQIAQGLLDGSWMGPGQNDQARGAWLAQSVEHETLDLGVVSSSPTLGAEMT